MDHMIDKVLDAIEKHKLINKGDGIVIGVSGGPDSLCLLHILYSLKDKMGLKLFVAHVNHMLRGDESLKDESFVGDICRKLNIVFESVHIDIGKLAKERGLSLEEAGRMERYRFFDSVADRYGAERIAVAHNKNDQAETVLMNIIRGSGLDGLKGMEYKRGRIIRPFLQIERAEIENYCREHGLEPRVDSSNLENIYTRNRIRLDLIPHIDSLFKTDIVKSIGRLADLVREDSSFIEEQIDKVYNNINIEVKESEATLNISEIKGYHIAVIRRIIRNIIKEIRGNLKGIESIHVDSITDLIENGRTGAMLHLPGGLRVLKSYEMLKIYMGEKEAGVPDFNKRVTVPGATRIDEINSSVEAFIIDEPKNIKDFNKAKSDSMVQFFDYDRLKDGINIRYRKDGDIFKPLGSVGTKKLKEFFIDSKIPRHIRDRIPLISKDKEIVWIIGYKISDKFKVTENTKTILKLIFKRDMSADD
ncbi:MAG TPA: tRNA lysidine(34) synthetase TilS [Acetivibrio sp.]|nr:tRNA lysidine(34) synthetase TilS [Acetivibrio sp.]HPT91545.1 tRNA lysidine(34) synthetase TilS [Acetivibrio sp.]